MRVLRVLFCLMCLLHAVVCHANCEGGGFVIHTTATYKSSDLSDSYFVLKSNSLTATSLDLNIRAKDFVGDYEVQSLFPKKCQKVTITKHPKFDSDYGPQLLIVGCDAKIENSYVHVDALAKKIRFSKKLEVRKSISDSQEKAISKQVNSIIANTDFRVYSRFKAPYENGRPISKSDIINLKDPPLQHASIGDKFQMTTALLNVKNIGEYFRHEGYRRYGNHYYDFTKRFVKYPVFFFTINGNSKFIGDGSYCSYMGVMESQVRLVNREMKRKNPNYVAKLGGTASDSDYPKSIGGLFDLGQIQKFSITNSFDFDGDEVPDIIEVNKSFAYRIGSDDVFEVINFGGGC